MAKWSSRGGRSTASANFLSCFSFFSVIFVVNAINGSVCNCALYKQHDPSPGQKTPENVNLQEGNFVKGEMLRH